MNNINILYVSIIVWYIIGFHKQIIKLIVNQRQSTNSLEQKLAQMHMLHQ